MTDNRNVSKASRDERSQDGRTSVFYSRMFVTPPRPHTQILREEAERQARRTTTRQA